MLFSTVLTALSGASLALGAPSLLKRQRNGTTSTNGTNSTGPSDTQILQFAMTLELLENAFYTQGLSMFNESDFEAAGFPFWVRNRFEQIAEHEATHVDLLRSILGSDAPEACEYNFPITDPKTFAAISMALETTGQSAYMGAAPLFSDPNTLETATTILTVEARQAAWVGSAVLKGPAWDGPFETPLGTNGVFSIASQFLVSCPSTNPPLPVVNLTALTVTPAAPTPGSTVSLNFTAPANVNSSSLFLAFLRGQQPEFAPISDSGNGTFSAVVPSDLQGTIYATVVSNNTIAATADSSILTGLAMFEFPFDSFANNNITTNSTSQ